MRFTSYFCRRRGLASWLAGALCVVLSFGAIADPARKVDPHTADAAAEIADIFSQMSDQIFEDCIFELSQEQIEVRQQLIQAYIDKGATGLAARRMAAAQITPPKLSKECQQISRTSPPPAAPPETETSSWSTQIDVPDEAPLKAPQKLASRPAPKADPGPPISLAGKTILPNWDCAPNVDYVTVHINGHPRKLTGGEICNPYQDVVREVPDAIPPFRFGYTITTGRLFVISNDPSVNGQTIAWAISGRDTCRNNPDPDCLATRSVGPLPPGEYTFSANRNSRVSWGPKTKRHVAGIYLRKLWNRERFTPRQTAAILARGNIAIHVRLKGEMSEACLGLEPKGWAYVASLIKAGRVTGVNVYIDEPHPQIAEAPPVVVASSFSFTSLFK